MRTQTFVRSAAIAVALVAATVVGQAQGRGMSQQAPKKTQVVATTPINLNTANATELEVLPGVGPAMAARIIEYRQKNGGFKKIEDLMNVKGIGEKVFLKLKPLVAVAPPKVSER